MSRPERLQVELRAAVAEDTPDVLEFTSKIWEGDDYVPFVWLDWLADPRGRLLVAVHENKVVGLGKLSQLSGEDWWLEGLRVNPEYEGRGIASQIHTALFDIWAEIGAGCIRLATASYRLPIHHLCDRLGFSKVAECSFFRAPVLFEDKSFSLSSFTLLNMDMIDIALDFSQQSPMIKLGYGLMDLGWQYAPPREEYFAMTVMKQRAFWWQHDRGLLFFSEDEEENLRTPFIQLIAGDPSNLAAMLLDYRRLAGAMSYPEAAWAAPVNPQVLAILNISGFRRTWKDSLYIYSRSKSNFES